MSGKPYLATVAIIYGLNLQNRKETSHLRCVFMPVRAMLSVRLPYLWEISVLTQRLRSRMDVGTLGRDLSDADYVPDAPNAYLLHSCPA